MPNVLLVNADELLLERLAGDPKWRVGFGTHARGTAAPAPDPTQWDLIVEDCGFDREPKSSNVSPSDELLVRRNVPTYWIPPDYTQQASRAKGIRLTQGGDCWGIRQLSAANQYRDVEFNLYDERGTPLLDFLHEFRADFPRDVILGEGRQGRALRTGILYLNAYDSPVVAMCLEDGAHERLVLIDIQSRERRSAALEYLCIRTAPKLWPSLYLGAFQSGKIAELSADKQRVTEQFKETIAAIDAEIVKEEDFYGRWAAIRFIGDDELKLLVSEALSDVFGFGVVDLDEQFEGAKNADLLINTEGWSCLVEVSGSTNRNAGYADLDDFDRHAQQFTDAGRIFDSRLLVFNGRYARTDEERSQSPTFSAEIVREAAKRGISLLDTGSLLRAIESVHTGAIDTAEFVERVRVETLMAFAA